jgi:tetratricopeptide (TPR) repeat protein
MDHPWVCRGVTHEYWDGPSAALPKEVAWIDDRNDGGCKSDKFERDIRLLESGLEEDPTNGRYMFYLAQTYHSVGRFKDSIAMYKKRIKTGGWFEEIWYSHYMIAQCYLSLKDPIRFEGWMLRAYAFRPERAEALYKLTKYFREAGEQYKAYNYLQKGRRIPQPSDSLFVEKDVYTGLFDYEATILNYYIGRKQDGLREAMEYLVHRTHHTHNVFQNLPFYIEPLEATPKPHPILRDVCGRDYHPTSTSIFTYKGTTYHNVRFVNYDIDHKTGSYMMKEGKYTDYHKVRTQNALWTPERTLKMNDASVTLPRKDKHILGLEDVRVYTNKVVDLCFTATTAEYSDKIRILQGKYHVDTGIYSECRLIESPRDQECEKNWIPIDGTDDIIYRWHPMEFGRLSGSTLSIYNEYPTPKFFEHLRGSAVPIRVGDELWCLVHFVEYSTPRKYYHCFVALSAQTYRPRAISLPFVFRENTIEYCIGVALRNEKTIEFVFSSMDDNPCCMHVPVSQFQWIQV